MSNNIHWIILRIAEARKHHASVPEAVSVRMKELLEGQLSEQQLTTKELTRVAKALLADMVPSPPEAEANQ